MSMLRSLQRRTHRGRITFLHYAQSPEHQIFADELDVVRRSGYGVDVHLLHPELGDPALSPAFLERLVPGYRDVAHLGVRPGADDQRRAGGVRRLRPAPGGVVQDPRRRRRQRRGRRGVHPLRRPPPRTPAPPCSSRPRPGLTPEFGCRMGICFSCTSRKTAGTVRNVVTGAESSQPDEDIQICVNQPVGDCAVEL